jgi:O-antigen biosynthesis protein WbqV
VRIVELAREMIRLAGLEPDADIPIVFTGLRPGEKIREELVGAEQTVVGTRHPKITCLRSPVVDHDWLTQKVDALRKAAVEMDVDQIVSLLRSVVKDYSPARAAGSAASRGSQGPVIGTPPSSRTQ